jgi:hypothetical protein
MKSKLFSASRIATSMMTTVSVSLVASMAILMFCESADAHRIRCGSTWEICAKRGRYAPFRVQQGPQVQPCGNQLLKQQR